MEKRGTISTCMSSVFVVSGFVVHKNPIFVIKKIKATQRSWPGVRWGCLWTQLKTSLISLEHTQLYTHTHTLVTVAKTLESTNKNNVKLDIQIYFESKLWRTGN